MTDAVRIKPRVLQVTAIPLTAARFLVPLAKALGDAGYSVEFASGPGEEQGRLRTAGFRVHTVALNRRLASPGNGLAMAQLLRLVRQQRYNVVHAHTPVAGLVARLAARLAGVPAVVYTLHGSLWETGPSLRKPGTRVHLYTAAEWVGARCTDHVFVINDADGRELVQRGLYSPAQVTNLGVGGGGVNFTRFQSTAVPPRVTATLRQSLGIPGDALVIGYLGRTVREKGVLDLIRAFTLVHQELPAACLLIAGGAVEGEWDTVSEADITATLGVRQALRQRVYLTGFRDDVPELLSTMDVVVLPSWREGFGMALAEAGAMGLPVVATRTRGGAQVVVHGETGFLVPVRDTQMLAAAITTILQQPQLARQLGAAGHLRARAHFGEETTIARQLAVYRTLCPPMSERYDLCQSEDESPIAAQVETTV